MSITPYNNFTVRDLTGIQQPYVNSTTELGYFRDTSVGTIPQNSWRSLPAVLNTNNGIASVDASGGVRILNPGVYSIKLSLFPTTTQDVSSNISFNFGNRYLFDVSTNVVADSFGGSQFNGMFTYDPSNNPYTPGIISWVADGYSSGNTGSNFIKTQTDELSFNYSTSGTGGQIFSGICTTKMSFILNSSKTIYFNVSTNSSTGVNMGNCVFTLQLISSYSLPSIIFWESRTSLTPTGSIPDANWTSIASSSDGTKLAAVVGGTALNTNRGIYRSINYGANWVKSDALNSINWTSITSSSDGVKLAAVVGGTSGTRGIYRSINSGANWGITDASNNVNWTSIASSSDGGNLAATVGGTSGATRGIYRSINSGANWVKTIASNATNWVSIASSSDGVKLAAVAGGTTIDTTRGIYTSINSGSNWVKTNASNATNWVSIASSSTGAQLVAVSSSTDASGGGIYTSTDPSNNIWVKRTTGIPATNPSWTSIASSSTGQYLAAVASGTYANGGGIYTSDTSGNSWVKQGISNGLPASNPNWTSIASSSDGDNLASVAGNATIYTGAYT